MKKLLAILLMLPLFVFAQGQGQGQQNIPDELKKLKWIEGPAAGKIGKNASIQIPSGHAFLGDEDTGKFLELMGNPPTNNHYLLAPKSLGWFAVFSFDESGYVKDDEKIDADALLKQLKESDEPSNVERRKLGLETLVTDGWQVTPHYDEATKQLEWGVRLKTAKGETNVNYTSRILGRSGVMSAVLVSDTEKLDADSREFKAALKSFTFETGEKYSEFKTGDKVAQYGLAALVLGGAAAVATKKGFWTAIAAFIAAFWKILAGVAVAAFAGLGSLFKKKKE